jgi:hypothetical protein
MNGFLMIVLFFATALTYMANEAHNKERDRQFKCFELTKEKTCFNPKGEK